MLVVTITGYDKGQFGTAPLDEIGSRRCASRHRFELFVDARDAVGATGPRQPGLDELSRRATQSDLAQVHVLAGSKMVELTVAIARHLSRTGNLHPDLLGPEHLRQRSSRPPATRRKTPRLSAIAQRMTSASSSYERKPRGLIEDARGDDELVGVGSRDELREPCSRTVAGEPTNEHASMRDACAFSAGVQ